MRSWSSPGRRRISGSTTSMACTSPRDSTARASSSSTSRPPSRPCGHRNSVHRRWGNGRAVVPQTDGVDGVGHGACSKHHRGTTMDHYAGIDVSLECSSVCVVEASGKIVREATVATAPEALIAWFGSLGFAVMRIGLEAGPLSQWLFAAMREGGLAVELLETRHVRDAFRAMPVKTDRNDARGIAQLMRLGWFRPV